MAVILSWRRNRNIAGLVGAAALTALSATASVAGPADTGQGGWYLRGEAGVVVLGSDTGYWHGPGAGDPRITFDLDYPLGPTAAAAFGYDWANGLRADVSFVLDANMSVTAKFRSASDGTTTGHTQTITTNVSAQALMANLFIEPLRMSGNDSPIQPFITGGLGIAHTQMGEWTRYNPSALLPGDVYRTFSGADAFGVAWTIGAGASIKPGDGPAVFDVTYRLSGYGNVSGGTTPTDNGNAPLEPFNFNLVTHTVTVGLRVPLG